MGVINLMLILPLWWRERASASTGDSAWAGAWLVPEVGLLALLALWPRVRRSRLLGSMLALVLTLVVVALAGDALVRAVFSRPLNIALDPMLLQAGYHLLDGSLGPWWAALVATLVALAVLSTALVAHALVRWALVPMPPRVALPLGLGMGLALAASAVIPGTGPMRPALAGLAGVQIEQIQDTRARRAELLARAESPRMQARAIPALAGRDVVVVFVESYGVSALDQPRYSETLKPVLARSKRALAAAGIAAVSTRMESPIRGGQSWLAHASVLSGQAIDSGYWYSMILAAGQDFLTDDFRATGHTSLVVAPAIVRPWPQARALGFDAVHPAAALEYQGPKSGWVGIPDQYTLHRYSRHLRPQYPGPVFSVLLLISSHAPWSPGPPLVRDWSRLDSPDPWPGWTPPEPDPLAYWRDTDRLRSRYPGSVAYSLEAVFSWAARDLPEDALLVVLGDHQPATLITGHEAGADVPVHMVSSDASLLSGLADRPGMVNGFFPPRRTSPSPGLEDLRFMLREL